MTIKQIRAISGLSQVKFGQKYSIPRRTVESWECDKNNPNYRPCPDYVIIPGSRSTSVAVQSNLTASGNICLNPPFSAYSNWLCMSMVKPAAAYSCPIDIHGQLELISIKQIKALC